LHALTALLHRTKCQASLIRMRPVLLHNAHRCQLHPDQLRHQQYTQLLNSVAAAADNIDVEW